MEPTPEEVRAQLERLLASEALATAARLRRFLRFIVERTLDGEGQQLKEYAVGIEVFERDEQYDPRIDSIVRVEAGRLRARLLEYYSQAGSDDTIIVRIPRGGYVPVFERRSQPELSSPASNGSAAQPRTPRFRARSRGDAGLRRKLRVLPLAAEGRGGALSWCEFCAPSRNIDA